MSDRVTLAACPVYRDPKDAVVWLERAYGVEPTLMILNGDDVLTHAEMRVGEALIMVDREWSNLHRSPGAVGGSNTQSIRLQLADGIDAHYERAIAAGAGIVQPPTTQFYGDRTYRVRDPEGPFWTFGQTVESVTQEEWARAGGLTVRRRL